MTTKEQDFEIEIEYLGITYLVYADLWEDGCYSYIKQTHDDPGGYEIIDDPVFYNFKIVDTETYLEVIPEHRREVLYIATEVLKNMYWDKRLNY